MTGQTLNPPQDIGAEACVLGSMMLENAAVPAALNIVSANDFFRPAHQTVFNALVRMRQQGKPIDLVAVRHELDHQGELGQVGGVEYVAALAEGVPSAANVAYYASIVREKSRLRQAIRAGQGIMTAASDIRADADAVFAEARKRLDDTPSGKPTPGFMSAADLVAAYPSQRDPVIEGLLRRGEVGNLVSAPKMNKSWLLLHVALCVALGRPVLGLRTRPGRVLLLDYELAPGTIAKRLQAVASAMGVSLADVGDKLVIESIRGKRLDAEALGLYFAAIKPGDFALVIIDPLYRTFPADLDENSNANLADLYAMFQGYAERLDAALIVVHHLTKGDQSFKSTTDLGAGGGSQARAADAHLAIRPHEQDGAAVVSGVVRSFPPFASIAIRWQYPLWELAEGLDVNALKRPPRRNAKAQEATPKPPKPSFDPDWLVATVLRDKPQTRDTIAALAVEAGVPNMNQAKGLLVRAIAMVKAYSWKLPKDNKAYFASIPQPALVPAEDCVSTKDSPHTPRESQQAPRGKGRKATDRHKGTRKRNRPKSGKAIDSDSDTR